QQAKRIQTSILNGLEKKALIWLAERQPKWVSSDMLSLVGCLGALMIGVGYALTSISPAFLWLASAGFIVNWYGDSLDGTLARVRNKQRPIYGYYLDHTLDCINEMVICIGLGMSPLMDMRIALLILLAYFLMTINVSVNAHLKGEFRLTYAKLGPTEVRIIGIIANTLLVLSPALRAYRRTYEILGHSISMTTLDFIVFAIALIILILYIITVIQDARSYSKIDPPKK
ncbi:MAG: CDP-alcohol phosphatidyltransferase family protein, partial [Bacteroidales bacterium]|nr:CDP-alcohol phosphatidyltransferase family protein [Bacteroidales bacterium]